MLENLYIKNVALIKEEEIDLENGLNIISGESGAGKSMFIDSINFVLGNKPQKDFIRHGEHEAIVSATFFIENNDTIEVLKNLDILVLEDNQIQIKRSINSKNKNNIKINGKTSTLAILKEISKYLVDIHLQLDNHELLKKSKHIEYLDLVCTDELLPLKKELTIYNTKYKEIVKQIETLLKDEQEKQRRIDILEFQLEELEEANLTVDEDESLENRQKMLSNVEKITNNSEKIVQLLYNGNDNDTAYDMITKAIDLLDEIKDVDTKLQTVLENLIEAQVSIEDISLTIRDYGDSVDGNPNELLEIEDRLSLIYRMKKKYGQTIEEILQYQDNISEELYTLNNSDKIIGNLKKEEEDLKEKCLSICSQITKIRLKNIPKVTKNIESSLIDLGMKDIKFDILCTKNDTFTNNGIDDVSFLISTNKGQDLKPLEKVVSGGEMSRIMIAIKALISNDYNIETFIFDEIDTGVSGRTAQKVGEKLREIGKQHQILCITHLPQIANMGSNNIIIYKETINQETITHIKTLNSEEKTKELARLIAGVEITDQTILAAKEMQTMAENIK